MSNTLLTIDMITNEALRIAHEKAQFIGTIDRQYDKSFQKTGAQIGSTLRVRKPAKYTVTTGRVMDVQDTTEEYDTITVATQKHIGMRVNSAELALSLDEFSKRTLEPAVAQLISTVEYDAITYATKKTANIAGTANTAITTLAAPGLARARLNQMLAPKIDRYIQMDSVTMGGLVNGVAAYFAPNAEIGSQYKEGLVKRTAMADYYENERVWTMPNSADVAGTLDTYTVTEGDADLTVTGLSAAPVEGMVFTLAGVYDVHPETKQAYSALKQFVVGAGSTTTNIVYSPAIYSSASGAKQNVSALPATTAAIAFVGDASSSYAQPLMYQKEAFQLVVADLPLMADSHKCVSKVEEGLSMRVWQQSDIRNDELLMRIDILYGIAALRPEWACRLIGSKNT